MGSRDRAGYPFAKHLLGDAASPLWDLEPEVLDRATRDDAARIERAMARLDAAVEHVRLEAPWLAAERLEELRAEGRARVRGTWWRFLDAVVALDVLKRRYDGWYGIDYFQHPRLHARAFAIAFGALCAQVHAGQALLAAVAGKSLAQTLFDEAMPEYGLPSGTFVGLRSRLARVRDQSAVVVGAEWYDEWIAAHLEGDDVGDVLAPLLAEQRLLATSALGLGAATATLRNKLELVRNLAFAAWFPIQRDVAEWFGDTRLVPESNRLISDAQIASIACRARPGDILVERRNWYLSNIGLPGFWPHAALVAGTQRELRDAFDRDPGVRERFGTFGDHLARARPGGWCALAASDAAGHPYRVLEAVSEGVVASSLEHTCAADYVAVLRPRCAPVTVARAIDRALALLGRPYDFDFDFATDDAVVCSELVVKAYETSGERDEGLRVPYVTVAGRQAIPPTEIVRVFAAERGRAERQLDFVCFFDGREEARRAVEGGPDDLARTVERPKWDLAQP